MTEIKWDSTASARYNGEYGIGNLRGIKVYRSTPTSKEIHIQAINTKGATYSCWMEVPESQVTAVAETLLSLVQKSTVLNDSVSVESLMEKYGPWGEHPVYGRENWGAEVALRNTQRGYWDWVLVRVETDIETEDQPA